MNEHFNLLIEQFKRAKGIKIVNTKSKEFIESFQYWLKEQERAKKDYLKLLKSLGVDYDKETSIEVGKGNEDSVFLPFKTTIVSPYMDESTDREGLTLSNDTKVSGSELAILEDGIYKSIPVSNGRIYLTQNVYHEGFLTNWHFLARNDQVVVGVFGKTTDRDMMEKIKSVKSFSSKLTDFVYNYGDMYDTYCYAVASTKRLKRRN